MRRTTFNDNWRIRPSLRSFSETGESGAHWAEVTLPHDALITGQREADHAGRSGWFPGGIFECLKDVCRAALEDIRALALGDVR